ncbi:MAG: glycosyltransferase [Cellvibrionaceae bacterium]
MAIRRAFIIVPSAVLDSPVKGAAALANSLTRWFDVTFVVLKGDMSNFSLLNDDVQKVILSEKGAIVQKILFLRRLLREKGGRDQVVSISSCLSADFVNSFCVDVAVTCATVRGDLPEVYPITYGKLGKWVAYCHLKRLSKVDYAISMTLSMSKQVEAYIKKPSPIIGNFIDEARLDAFRRAKPLTGPYKFVYTGSLIYGKQPQLLVQAVVDLLDRGFDVELDVLGDGPLLDELKCQAGDLFSLKSIRFHGYVKEPFKYIAAADVLVLPSISEGVSRSVLESLYLGIPSVVRNINGSSELVHDGVNGALFNEDADLPDVMLRVAKLSRSNEWFREVLIPECFRQYPSVEKYIKLLEKHC